MSKGEQALRVGLRRNVVGLGGAVIMSGAIVGPAVSRFFYSQFSVIVVWVALVAAGAVWFGRQRPDALTAAGAVFAAGGVEEAVTLSHHPGKGWVPCRAM